MNLSLVKDNFPVKMWFPDEDHSTDLCFKVSSILTLIFWFYGAIKLYVHVGTIPHSSADKHWPSTS